MSKPVLLQDTFRGAYQDAPRHQLPKGKVWQVTDMIPNFGGGGLFKRSGWTRPRDVMSAGTSAYAGGCSYAPFVGGPMILGFDEDGLLYQWGASGTTATNVGASYVPVHPPTFYRELAIICDPAGAAAPKKYNGTTLAALGGSPPNGAVSTVYKDHLVLGYASATPNRVWFSSAGTTETWDTAADGQWLDCSAPVRGLATLRNMLFVFEDGQIERIRGDVIPGVVGSDFVREPAFPTIGCSHPASIAVTDDYVIWANGDGVFLSDGIGVVSLTEQCGMSEYWRTKMVNFSGPSTYTLAGGIWKGWYLFSVMSGTTIVMAGMIHIQKREWVTLSNFGATMIAVQPMGVAATNRRRMIFSERAAPRISDLDPIFWSVDGVDPTTQANADGDGTALTCSVELPYYTGSPGKKTWKNLYVSYILGRPSGGGTSPFLTVAVTSARIAGAYTNLTPTLTVTDSAAGSPYGGEGRKRIPLNSAVAPTRSGVGVKLTQSNSSYYTALLSVEADVYEREGSRV